MHHTQGKEYYVKHDSALQRKEILSHHYTKEVKSSGHNKIGTGKLVKLQKQKVEW